MRYYLDNEFLLDNPWITEVGCGGTGGFVAEGLCRLFQGQGGHHRPGRPRPGGAPQPAQAEFLPQQMLGASRARPWPTGWRGPTGGLSVTQPIPCGGRTPGTKDTAIPACPATATACSSAAPTTPPPAGPWPSACPGARTCGSSTRATTPTGANLGWQRR